MPAMVLEAKPLAYCLPNVAHWLLHPSILAIGPVRADTIRFVENEFR